MTLSLAARLALAAVLVGAVGACGRSSTNARAGTHLVSRAERADALRRAHVWHPPSTGISTADLSLNPPGPFRREDSVDCTFVPRAVGGTTPKFYCTTADGETVKVKYGPSNPELPAELAATRLLGALGFETDRMYAVASVRCLGCPPFPYEALRCFERTEQTACLAGASTDRPVIIPAAVIERTAPGRPIESSPGEGWAWFELDTIDPRVGGASRAETDAFRLLAVLLAHWDNKAENQRLICPPGNEGGRCAAPVAMIHDLGATFGPLKMELRNWRRTPVWADRAECRVSMKALPFGGGTFPDSQISEEGRRMLLRLLRQLSREQVRALFTGIGVETFDRIDTEARDPEAWTEAFIAKVREVESGGPCPRAAALRASRRD